MQECSRGWHSGHQPPSRSAGVAARGVPRRASGKHIVMSDGTRQVTVPRHNPIKAFTLGGIVRDAGLTVEEFRCLL